MSTKGRDAITALDVMYSEILQAVARGVTKLRELDQEHAALELESWGRGVERQQRTLPVVLANVGEELREQGADVNAERFEAALRESRKDEP